MNGRIASEASQQEASRGFGGWPSYRLEIASGTLWRDEKSFKLRAKTLAVLGYIVAHSGTVISREQLYRALWMNKAGSENGPKQCIRELRLLLEDTVDSPRFTETGGRQGYRFIGNIAVFGESGSAATDAAQRPLCVGREPELAALAEGFDAARRSARSICIVGGEPGAGKTRLVDSFIARLPDQADQWIARGQCLPLHGQHEPYGPLLEALRSLIETSRSPPGRSMDTAS